MNNVVSLREARQERMSDDKPALGDGYCRVVNALAEGLASHPISSVQQRVVWAVIRMTYGWSKGKDRIAASQLAEITGLRRQQCSTALNQLIECGVIIREGGSRSAIKLNTKVEQWSFEKKATKGLINERVNTNHEKCSVNSNCGHSTNTICGHTKDKRQSNSLPSEDMSEQSSGRSQNPEPETPPQNQKPNAVVQSKSGRKWGEAIDLELAELMAATIDARLGQDAPANRNMLTWANDVRLMRERDNRPPEAIKALFAWTQQHHFWCANILSPAKLRTKWATLASQRNESRKGAGHGKGNAGNRADADAELTRQQTDLRYAIDNF